MSFSNENVGAAVLPQSKGVFERIIGIFTSPAETMRDIAARPSWLLPLLLVTVVSAGGTYFLKDVIVQQEIEKMHKKNMTEEQIQQAMPFMDMMGIIAPVSTLIFMPIMYLVIAGVGLFVGNVILGGETKFSTLFAVTCWSGIITVLSYLVNIPVMVNRETMESATGLSPFFAAEENKTFFHHLLGQIDLFMLWGLVVLGFGVAAAYKFPTKKAMTMVFVVWAIFAIGAAFFKSMFS